MGPGGSSRAEGDETGWVLAEDLHTITASSSVAGLLAAHRDTLAGQPWFVSIPASSRDEVESLFDADEPNAAVFVELRRLDGERVPVEAVKVAGGRQAGRIVVSLRPRADAAVA
jgi:hypothetical protein